MTPAAPASRPACPHRGPAGPSAGRERPPGEASAWTRTRTQRPGRDGPFSTFLGFQLSGRRPRSPPAFVTGPGVAKSDPQPAPGGPGPLWADTRAPHVEPPSWKPPGSRGAALPATRSPSSSPTCGTAKGPRTSRAQRSGPAPRPDGDSGAAAQGARPGADGPGPRGRGPRSRRERLAKAAGAAAGTRLPSVCPYGAAAQPAIGGGCRVTRSPRGAAPAPPAWGPGHPLGSHRHRAPRAFYELKDGHGVSRGLTQRGRTWGHRTLRGGSQTLRHKPQPRDTSRAGQVRGWGGR